VRAPSIDPTSCRQKASIKNPPRLPQALIVLYRKTLSGAERISRVRLRGTDAWVAGPSWTGAAVAPGFGRRAGIGLAGRFAFSDGPPGPCLFPVFSHATEAPWPGPAACRMASAPPLHPSPPKTPRRRPRRTRAGREKNCRSKIRRSPPCPRLRIHRIPARPPPAGGGRHPDADAPALRIYRSA